MATQNTYFSNDVETDGTNSSVNNKTYIFDMSPLTFTQKIDSFEIYTDLSIGSTIKFKKFSSFTNGSNTVINFLEEISLTTKNAGHNTFTIGAGDFTDTNAILPVGTVIGLYTNDGTGMFKYDTGSGTQYVELDGDITSEITYNTSSAPTIVGDIKIAMTTTEQYDQYKFKESIQANYENNPKSAINIGMSTGVISFDGISINSGDNSLFDLGAVVGYIMDVTVDPSLPKLLKIEKDAETAITITNLATDSYTYVAIDKDKNIIQKTSPFTGSENRNYLILGRIVHPNNTTINYVENEVNPVFSPTNQLGDLSGVLRFVKFGLDYVPNGSNLKINRNQGKLYRKGSNLVNDKTNPNIRAFPPTSALTFRYRKADGTEFSDITDIVPGSYDNSGTLTSVPDTKYTVQTIAFFHSGITRIQYGTKLYDSILDAKHAIVENTFTFETGINNNSIIITYLVVRGDATDLSNEVHAQFVQTAALGRTAARNVRIDPDFVKNTSSTGLINGGSLSINSGDNTKFDIAAGNGQIIDTSTDPDNPTLTLVRWDAKTAVNVSNVATQNQTYVTLDVNKNFIEYVNLPNASQRRSNILLGILHHSSRTQIDLIQNLPTALTQPVSQLHDTIQALGNFNISGNRIEGNATTLQFKRTAGEIFSLNINNESNKDQPHYKYISESDPQNFYYIMQDNDVGTSTNTINPANYDNSGTKTTVPNSTDATTQRVYFLPCGDIFVEYGQTVYSNLQKAIEGLSTESHTKANKTNNEGILLATITLTKNCTDLTDSDTCYIFNQPKFGAAQLGGSANSITSLQQAYDNATPSITTSGEQGEVIIKDGTGTETNNNIVIKNNSDATTASIQADGLLMSSSIEIIKDEELTGNVSEGFSSSIKLDPAYSADSSFTVTRHNYIDVQNVAQNGSSSVTDGCVLRFDANENTHVALEPGSSQGSALVLTHSEYIKVNINGNIRYIGLYDST